MSAEENQALVRRWYEEVWNAGRADLIDELVAEDFVLHHTSLPGRPVPREAYKQLLPLFRTAFPDFRITVEDMLAHGDRVAVRLRQTGTHRGEFRGIPPSGKRVDTTALAILRFAGGRIAEAWGAERDWPAVLADARDAP
jgi:steroid delta-isomerase-like uncharacterized protein